MLWARCTALEVGSSGEEDEPGFCIPGTKGILESSRETWRQARCRTMVSGRACTCVALTKCSQGSADSQGREGPGGSAVSAETAGRSRWERSRLV